MGIVDREDAKAGPDMLNRDLLRIAARHADRTALRCDGRSWTYAALFERAQSLAQAINTAIGARVTHPTGDAPLAALLLPHDDSIVTAILASLLAGYGYVPLDLRSPPERLRRLVALSGAPVIITDGAHAGLAGEIGPQLDIVRIDLAPPVQSAGLRALARGAVDADPAYLLFTSGTTGEPRGVAHSRRSLLRSATCFVEDCDIGTEDRIALIISCCYTPSVFCIFGAFLTGASLVLYDLTAQPLTGVAKWLSEERITSLYAVPTLFRRLSQAMERRGGRGLDLTGLRWIQLAGEPVLAHDVALYRQHFADHAKLYNGMGTTETSCVTRHTIDATSGYTDGPVPIGLPYDDMAVRIEGSDGVPAPEGVPGEIVVTSPFTAAGYWRSPMSGDGRFRQESGADGPWTFRSGDLGLWRADGTLVHLGRADAQVKINGQRVDPAEIETVILSFTEVGEAVVSPRPGPDDTTVLIAYVTGSGIAPLDLEVLRGRVARRLAPHQVPGRFVRLAQMPTTISGKINRSALPSPSREEARSAPKTEGPGDMIAEVIGQFFGRVLDTDPAGSDEDFFFLGGDSLRAMELCMLIEQHCGSTISPSALVHSATPRALAGVIRAKTGKDRCPGVVILHHEDMGAVDPNAVPLFCISGMGGHVLCWRELSVLLGPAQPCYGLEMPGLDGRTPPLDTVDALVNTYQQQIECAAPSGPVALAGYSAGGVFVFELAKRLEAAGRTVTLAAMLDSYAPSRLGPITRSDVVQGWLRFARTRPPGTVARAVVRRMQVRLGLADQLPSFFSRKEDMDEISLNMPFDREHPAVQACERALGAYMPEAQQREVLFFKAQTPPPPAFGGLNLYGDWDRLTHGRIKTIEVPGAHAEILHGPSIAAIARHLGPILLGQRLGPDEGPLGPLGSYWTLDGAPQPATAALDAGALPAPYQDLLDHDRPMTPTLAGHFGEPMKIRVLAQRRGGQHYVRKITMEGERTGRVTQIALIRIDLTRFDKAAQDQICHSDRPFGQVLAGCGIAFTCRPTDFFAVTPDEAMASALGLDGPPQLYGRRNQLKEQNGFVLADVIEILAPTEIRAATSPKATLDPPRV